MKNAPAFPFSALCAALLCASCGNDRGAPAAESAEVVEAPAATAETAPAAADNASPPALADAIADAETDFASVAALESSDPATWGPAAIGFGDEAAPAPDPATAEAERAAAVEKALATLAPASSGESAAGPPVEALPTDKAGLLPPPNPPPETLEEEEKAALDRLVAAANEAFDADRERFSDTNRWFVSRAVVADREARTVRVDAFTTGLPPGSILEFFLITLNSGHDYEGVFRTVAFASDIARAVEFLGLPPGRRADPAKLRFWPIGERVLATASIDGAEPVPFEAFAADAATGGPIPAEGFVYIGGARLPDGTLDVDSRGPGSIVPSYNEPVTVFDVPRRAPQAEVYQSVVSSKLCPTNAFVPVRIVLSPEPRPEGSPRRVRDLALRLSGEGLALDGAAPLPPAEAIAALRGLREKEAADPVLAFSWDDAVPCGRLRIAARLLRAVDDEKVGLRVDAPPEGFPYYQAFLPQEQWRDRERRFAQPCELRLVRGEDGAAAATLVAIEEIWKDDALKPELKVEEFPVADAAAFRAKLSEKAPPSLDALLVFVPGDLPYGELRPFLDAARPTHPVVQIFVD